MPISLKLAVPLPFNRSFQDAIFFISFILTVTCFPSQMKGLPYLGNTSTKTIFELLQWQQRSLCQKDVHYFFHLLL